MHVYQTVILCEVIANSYEEAMDETRRFAEVAADNYTSNLNAKGKNPEDGLPQVQLFDYDPSFEMDNYGQRVMYLHSKNSSMDADAENAQPEGES